VTLKVSEQHFIFPYPHFELWLMAWNEHESVHF